VDGVLRQRPYQPFGRPVVKEDEHWRGRIQPAGSQRRSRAQP
jgi:hypothetical protein